MRRKQLVRDLAAEAVSVHFQTIYDAVRLMCESNHTVVQTGSEIMHLFYTELASVASGIIGNYVLVGIIESLVVRRCTVRLT